MKNVVKYDVYLEILLVGSIYVTKSEWGGFPWMGYLIPVRGACWWLLGVVVVGSSCVVRRRRRHFQDSSGWHSGQGSLIPGITKEIKLRKQIGGNTARLFTQNFDARLAGIVIWSDRPLFFCFYQGTLKSLKNHKIYKIHVPKFQDVFFLRSPKRRRQPPPDAQGWETQKSMKIDKIIIYMHKEHLFLKKVKTLKMNSPKGDYTRRKGLGVLSGVKTVSKEDFE